MIVVSQETVGFPNVLVESVSSPSFLMNFCQLHYPGRRFRDLNVFVGGGGSIRSQPRKCMYNGDTIGAIQLFILIEKKLEEGCLYLFLEKDILDLPPMSLLSVLPVPTPLW